jgi:hypothetical protein
MSEKMIPIDLFRRYQEAEAGLQVARSAEFSARTKLGQAERAVQDAVAALNQLKREFPSGTFSEASLEDKDKPDAKDEALLVAAAQVVNSERVFKKSDAMAKLPVGIFREDFTDQDVDYTLKRLMKSRKIKNVDRGRYRLLG